jgi:tripartite-type tricarboxylate transporter receptor subunit TctC
VLAPGGTLGAIVRRLNAEILKAMRTPEMHERMVTKGGNEIVTGTPEDLAALIRSDLQKYAKLVKDARIPAQ